MRHIYKPMDINEYDELFRKRSVYPESGEIVIDRAKNNFCVIDDYGIPIFNTSYLQEMIAKHKDSSEYFEMLANRDKVKMDLIELNYRVIASEQKVIQLERRNDDLQNGSGFIDQHRIYIDRITKFNVDRLGRLDIKINDTKGIMDGYIQRLNNLQTEFNKINSTLTNSSNVQDQRNQLLNIWNEIQAMIDDAKLKLNKLGSGNGSITVSKPVTREEYREDFGWLRWMSNNKDTYNGGSHRFDAAYPRMPEEKDEFRAGLITDLEFIGLYPIDATWHGAKYKAGSGLNPDIDSPYRPAIGQYPEPLDNRWALESWTDRSQDPVSNLTYYPEGVPSQSGVINYWGRMFRIRFGGTTTITTIEYETIYTWLRVY